MSAISNLLNQIKTAIYGEQVRDAIHDAIAQCYTDVSNAKTIADNSNYTAQQSIQQANSAVDAANAAQQTADNAIADVTAARDTAVQAKDDAVSVKNNVVTLAGQVNSDKTEVVGIKNELVTLAQSVNEDAQNASDSANDAADSAQEADDIRATIDEMFKTTELDIPDRIKLALIDCFQHVAWTDSDGKTYYNALVSALEPPVVDYITATFSQGNNKVYTTDTLSSLRKYLEVKAFYTNGKQAYTRGYTLSGKLVSGNSTITVTYSGKTASFVVNVAVAAVNSITCTYQQSGNVYTTDTLDVLRNDLTVVANMENGTQQTLDDLNYELSGTLSEGTSTITVTYGGKTATFNVTVSEEPDPSSNILYSWDLTKSLTDSISGKVATTNGTRNSNGLSFEPVNTHIDFGTVYSRNRTYEIDIDHIGLPSSESRAYRRIFCFGENGTNTSANTAGLPVAMSDYRPGWWWYLGNQWDTAAMGELVSTVDSYDFFDGKTMKIYIDSTGYAHVWAKLINQPSSSYVKIGDSHSALNDYNTSNAHVYIGGDSDNLADTLIKAFRVYEGEV